MTFRRAPLWATGPRGDDSAATDGAADATADSTEPGRGLTADQYREWQRWVVEAVPDAGYAVVPIETLVGVVQDRDPTDTEPSAVRAALTETILPRLDAAGVFDYDAERDVVVVYTK